MTLALALLVFVAFAVEATLGFGGTVIVVSFGVLLMPLDELLFRVIPVNVTLSAFLAARHAKFIDLRLLGLRLLPLMLLGLPLGVLASRGIDGRILRGAFGVFVVLLAVRELARPKVPEESPPALPTPIATVLLLLAGAMHGAFGAGGPVAVYVAGRRFGGDKARFRATLSALWLIMNLALVTTYVVRGAVNGGTLRVSALLLPSVALGIFAGEQAHVRIPKERFATGVFAVLLVAGVVVCARAALAG
ncbi:MAG: sulfite exporter TauE/SafE family protein [Myxococcales bacterium]|nr:sulfite exporter TauE/SafE family protein [Myxococcales bacterium]MBL0197728.1 sulfite exporter TauE/SafE family protein [Myxococcales bacterium]HQY65616.1 sulfite exporter TauE/SafE family protein [Polyangiaceae bacterium]